MSFRCAVCLTFLVVANLFSQQPLKNLSYYQENYQNDQAIVLNHKQLISVHVNKNGELDIFETDFEEILYLKNSARFYTDQGIYLSDFFEDLVEVSAYVIDDNGKKLKLKKDDFRLIDSEPSSWVFHDDDKELVFDLPKIRPGYKSIIEYTKKLKRPQFFDRFYFIGGYPIEYATIQITFHPDVNISFYERAFEKYDVKKTETLSKKGEKIVLYELKNIRPFNRERGATNIYNHLPHIVAQITSYKHAGQEIKLIGNLNELHAFFEDLLLQKENITNKREIISITQALIENKSTEFEKIDTIYKWVQDNIKYIAFEDGINGYVPRPSDLVMKNRYGDCKDMSSLLIEMLNVAEVDSAYVAWVGTNDIPYQMSEIPSPLTCNHVIAVIEKPDGTFYYLDATGSEMGVILPPDVIQEKEILIHKGPANFQLYKVPAVEAKYNYFKLNVSYYYDEKTDSIRGNGEDCWGGYERESRSYDLKNSEPEDLIDYVKDLTLGDRNRYRLINYNLHNVYDNHEELRIDYEFSADNLMIKDGDELILNPILFTPGITKYSANEYQYDRFKNHHRKVDYRYTFQIPKGYHIKSMPQNINFNHDLFNLETNFTQNDNAVIAHFTYQYHLLKIPASLFDDWNQFADAVMKSTAQCVVFKKN